ncbi:MAG: hypothetical protein H0Z28_12900 [Archaeoglobus sp.]|nr:hypothetical protein [Archaeoglobus sp.]
MYLEVTKALEKVELKRGGPPPPPPPDPELPELELPELDELELEELETILPEIFPVADSAMTGCNRRIKITIKQMIFLQQMR